MQGNSKKNNNQSIVEILNERLTKLTTASIFTFQTGNFSILHREMYATQQRIKNFFDNKVAPLNIPNQNAQTNTKAHETASTNINLDEMGYQVPNSKTKLPSLIPNQNTQTNTKAHETASRYQVTNSKAKLPPINTKPSNLNGIQL